MTKKRRAGARRAAAAALSLLAAAACTPLTAFNALVPKDSGAELAVTGAAYGPDPRQRLDLYRPRRPEGPLPVIVFFYGGSWNSGTKAGYAFVGRALAARGFLVAIPDYRLVPQVRYPAFVEDGAAATQWVGAHATQYGGDPRRIVLAGHSAGAYIGAMLAYDRRWLGAEQASVRGFAGLAGPYDFLPFTGEVTRAAFLGTSDLQATQPVNHVMRGAPPALLATGSQDRTVLPRNSDALAERLRAAGTAVSRREYANVGHVGILTTIARPLRGRAQVLDDLVAFARAATAQPSAEPVRAPRLSTGPDDQPRPAITARTRGAVERRAFSGTTHVFFGADSLISGARDAQQWADRRLREALWGNLAPMPGAAARPSRGERG